MRLFGGAPRAARPQSTRSRTKGYDTVAATPPQNANPQNANPLPLAAARPSPPKVGYESDGGPHGERHPPPPGDRHYETAADGRTREVHGGMVGPGEEELLASDDSDKVGYA